MKTSTAEARELAEHEAEIRAMDELGRILIPLSPAERERVLQVVAFLQSEQAREATEAPPVSVFRRAAKEGA